MPKDLKSEYVHELAVILLKNLIIYNTYLKDHHFQPSYNFDPSGFGQRVWMTPNDAMKLKKMYMCE